MTTTILPEEDPMGVAHAIPGLLPAKPEYICPECGGHEFTLHVLQAVIVEFHEDDAHHITAEPYGNVEWDL